jgi:flagellar motility protein MotE (MotC chaperone)
MDGFLARFRLLPLLVLVASLAFAVRIGETVTDVRDLTASAIAAEDSKTEEPAKTEEKAEAEDAAKEKAAETAKSEDKKPIRHDPIDPSVPQPSDNQPEVSLPDSTLPEVWADPSQQDMSDTPEQMRLLEDLAKRRQQLDDREKALNNREALMKAAEKQIDGKLGEMATLKGQIEKLLGDQESEENDKIQSLVKIYEGMKPKNAAEIFNQMDINVLLQVISKMSERKSAPIIAAMDTMRANELTVRLTEMKKLPEQKPEFMGTNTGPAPTQAPAGSAPLPGLDALGQP